MINIFDRTKFEVSVSEVRYGASPAAKVAVRYRDVQVWVSQEREPGPELLAEMDRAEHLLRLLQEQGLPFAQAYFTVMR